MKSNENCEHFKISAPTGSDDREKEENRSKKKLNKNFEKKKKKQSCDLMDNWVPITFGRYASSSFWEPEVKRTDWRTPALWQ